MCNIWVKEILRKETFPKDLKNEDVPPVFKKDNPHLVKNYIPVSVLSIVSKKCERIMQKQIIDYKNQYLSPTLYGYRKGFSRLFSSKS